MEQTFCPSASAVPGVSGERRLAVPLNATLAKKPVGSVVKTHPQKARVPFLFIPRIKKR